MSVAAIVTFYWSDTYRQIRRTFAVPVSWFVYTADTRYGYSNYKSFGNTALHAVSIRPSVTAGINSLLYELTYSESETIEP